MKVRIEKIIFKVVLFIPLLVFLFGSFRFIQDGNNAFKIDKMIITGTSLNGNKDLHDLYWSYYGNRSIFDINESELKDKLLDNEFISDVNIIKILPNTIIFDIVEISPIAKIELNNHNVVVDDKRHKFILSKNINSERFSAPEIKFSSNIDEDEIFDSIEYNFLNYIFLEYPQLYSEVRELKKIGDYMLISMENGFLEFNSQSYLHKEQLKNLSTLMKKNKIDFNSKNYEYIKFMFESIIIKERDVS